MTDVPQSQIDKMAAHAFEGNGCKIAHDLTEIGALNYQSASQALKIMTSGLPWNVNDRNPQVLQDQGAQPGVSLTMHTPSDHYEKGWFDKPGAEANWIPKDILDVNFDPRTGSTTIKCKDYNYDQPWAPGQKSWPTPKQQVQNILSDFHVLDEKKK